ncbi:MAG: hypothetical protein U9R19_04960, partial [Bacteroidota bacterium]|nr:hypothetical protein [Bacteroidota bacterium]
MNINILYKSLALSVAILFSITAFAWNTPVQVSPATGSQSWNAVDFDWDTVNVSLAYQFQLDTNSTFSSPVFFDTIIVYVDATGYSDTQVLMEQLFFGTTYHWRVRAYTATDTSAWSPVWTVTTRDYVTPVSPVAGTETYVEALLDWDSHVGINYYDYQIDTTGNFNSPALVSG